MTRICAVIALALACGFKGFCQEPIPPDAKEPPKMEIQEGKFLVVIGTVRLVNPGGWNVRELRDEAAKATKK